MTLALELLASWAGYLVCSVIFFALGYVACSGECAEQARINARLAFRLEHGRWPTVAEALRLP